MPCHACHRAMAAIVPHLEPRRLAALRAPRGHWQPPGRGALHGIESLVCLFTCAYLALALGCLLGGS